MDTVKIENKGRQVWHFPVVVKEKIDQGTVSVELYRVVVGDSVDAQITKPDPDRPGRMKKVPNIARVPEDAITNGWSPTKSDIFLPAPTVVMTVEQYTEEVFPRGSTARGILDELIGEGTITIEESTPGAIAAFEQDARENSPEA